MIDGIADLGLIEDEDIELDRAALRLAALDNPGAKLSHYEGFLDTLQDEVKAAAAKADTLDRRAAALRAILSDKHDFRGDSETYDDSANANLMSVLDRRRGLPVALAILYVALARRLGWSAFALNTPAHVVIALEDDVSQIVLDPFNGGRTLSADALQKLIMRATGSWQPLDRSGWAPMENRAVLVRLLNNQATRAMEAGDLERTAALYQRLTTIDPAHAQLWWKRADVETRLGRNREARASLSALLETTTDSERRRHIIRALENIGNGG